MIETITVTEAAKMAGISIQSLSLYMQKMYETKQEIEFGMCFKNRNKGYFYKIYKDGFINWLDKKSGKGV